VISCTFIPFVPLYLPPPLNPAIPHGFHAGPDELGPMTQARLRHQPHHLSPVRRPLNHPAAMNDPSVIGKMLSHLGLPTRAPPKATARLDAFFQTASSLARCRFSSCANTLPLPSSHPHTPHWNAILARSGKNGPVRPDSQDERLHCGQQSPGIEIPAHETLYTCILIIPHT